MKKLMVRIILILLAVVCLIHLIGMVTFDRIIEYKDETLYSAKLPAALDGYRIAFVTDFHDISESDMQGVADELNRWEPDLLLSGGDYPSNEESQGTILSALADVRTTDGSYGVEGNHDDYKILFAAMEQHGIIPLSNSGVSIRDGFYLAGTEDLWNREPDVAQAVSGAADGDFVLLLSHNPDTSMQQDTKEVDLILSGHTHGGQITLFGAFAPALSMSRAITDYGQRFQSGWARSKDGCPVYVSNGTGFLTTPRIFARPQVVLLTLRGSSFS